MHGRAGVRALAMLVAGCGSPPAAQPPSPPVAETAASSAPPATPAPTSSSATSEATEPPPSTSTSAGRPCGDVGCLAFSTAEAAFEHALAAGPRIVALGEAHAQKDAPKVKSTVRRFAEELLPKLEGRATDLVLELLTTNGSCGKAVENDVAERQKPVTEPQAASNQNQYVTLGALGKKLGIAPHPLVPECEELRAVSQAGAGDIDRLLVLIADAMVRETEKLLASTDPKRAIVLYGGALHNDLTPRPGRERWSYGPRLSKSAGGRYVEVDLVIPEYVKPTPSWQGFPWYAAWSTLAPSSETILYQPAPASFVLIFPRSAPSSGPAQP